MNNNQAYASIDIHNNFKEIGEKIKKACPAYQGNLDINIIKGLVTDVLKACLPNSHNPPTTPNPNPDPNLQNGTMDFSVRLIPDFPSNVNVFADIVLQWFNKTSGDGGGLREYNLEGNSDDALSAYDVLQVPVGYIYSVTLNKGLLIIDKPTRNCSPLGDYCTGTMQKGTYPVSIYLNTGDVSP